MAGISGVNKFANCGAVSRIFERSQYLNLFHQRNECILQFLVMGIVERVFMTLHGSRIYLRNTKLICKIYYLAVVLNYLLCQAPEGTLSLSLPLCWFKAGCIFIHTK